MKTYTIWNDWEIKLLQNKHATLDEIQSQMPYRTMRSIRAKCAKIGAVRAERGKSHRRLDWSRSFMTKYLSQFLDGFLLGDGCLVGPNGRNQKQAYLKFGQKYKECRDYFVCPFRDYMPLCSSELVKARRLDRHKHRRFIAHTKTHPDFTKQHERWYRNGKKIIPTDLLLTPIVVTNWYIGDGSNDRGNIRLHSQGFKDSEIDSILLPQMKDLNFEPRRDKVNDIRLTRRGSIELIRYITTELNNGSRLRCYSYKFEV